MSHDPVVEPSALGSLPAFRLLDVRDRTAFSSGHARNAVRVPIEIWEAAAKTGETFFENVAYWQRAIDELGVDGDVPAIVYDDGRMTEAARVWFILQYFGARAFILNGGWPAIEGRDDLSGAAEAARNSGPFQARPGAGLVGLVDRLTLKAELHSDVRIFDARTAGEYTGEDLRRNTRGGHLPGARLLPHANLLDGARLRPAAELHDLLAQAGFRPDDHIVTHCDGGGRAALAAAAAARAGYDDVRAYYLSFADWAKDESCTIVGD
ncbi:sulfurtransferase [Ancylobacter polymorphus]|uniref:Thiosulfate/3-mercaptopyruvate sulfurtransferase n=1 Tax=Ancylobacter polymorphus TaxID=223390 RepID=A0ABU0BIL6_9HYPH|nr:rhodanese-like domain-containing protein [Ancylobacter polymorphus]MDQ0304897.1 thiosulfate/3-mercaptopyruvate sulfurtransferase [Ancylobacter polymorphus]